MTQHLQACGRWRIMVIQVSTLGQAPPPTDRDSNPLHKDQDPHTGDETPYRDQGPPPTRVRNPYRWIKSFYIRMGTPPQESKSP